jgi:putative PIG3 family NAD(P)H quinone oxidoreductase
VRAVVITHPGGPEVLEVQNVPAPVPGPGEVLIDVAAAGLNRADVLQREGNYPPPRGASPYLGMECSGRITQLGDGVTGWNVGAEVCALLAGGGYAEQVAAPVGQLMPVPPGVSLVDAAALPEATCTVHSMVFEEGRLQPGERLLVHGGSSGIGTMAIQLAHQYGVRVVTTAGTPRKLAICTELGADLAINYHEDDFAEVIAEHTDRAGMDVILDIIGAKYLPRNVRSLAVGGRLIVLGLQGGVNGELNLGALLAKRAWVHAAGLRGRSLAQKAAIVASTVAFVWPQLADGRVRPIIDRVLSLDDAAEAHQLLESSEHIGKVLLRVG